MPLPPLLLWTIGAAVGVVAARLVLREWQRVNAMLHPVDDEARLRRAAAGAIPTLRRDPRTGVYRPG